MDGPHSQSLPEDFLDFVWTGSYSGSNNSIKPHAKAVGFKSFPEHWSDVRNDACFSTPIMQDFRIKKIVLRREDELAVFVSMLRTDQTSLYLTHAYPQDLRLHVDPAKFQAFLDRYRYTFRKKYHSPVVGRDTFHLTYEQMVGDEDNDDECNNDFATTILPKLYDFLGVDTEVPFRKLKETVKQADPDEDLSQITENYDELEFCFRHTSVLHFSQRKERAISYRSTSTTSSSSDSTASLLSSQQQQQQQQPSSWSLLLPICSRGKSLQALPKHRVNSQGNANTNFNTNRFLELSNSSQHNLSIKMDDELCWAMLQDFGDSLRTTASIAQLQCTEAIVGIDVDDPVYQTDAARKRIETLLPCRVKFVTIQPEQYGKACQIWNVLAKHAANDYIVLLGDDIRLLDQGWQHRIVDQFYEVALRTGLPLVPHVLLLTICAFPAFLPSPSCIAGTWILLARCCPSSSSIREEIRICTNCILASTLPILFFAVGW